MSNLTANECRKLEAYFEMSGGYFLDSTNSSLEQFVRKSVGLEFYSDKYKLDSGSKANRIRAIWGLETNQLVGKLIRDAIQDGDNEKWLYSDYRNINSDLKHHCLEIAKRLESSNNQIEQITVQQPSNTNNSANQTSASGIFSPILRPSSASIFTQVQQPTNKNIPLNHSSNSDVYSGKSQQLPHSALQSTTIHNPHLVGKNKVFIVHGHDDLAKEQLARFVSQIGLEPIILHEQASSSYTIIEKIEKYANEVCYAIVLYTPCDQGSKASVAIQSPRARQNVVFEHGYFIGKLGRKNVTAIVKGDLEKPNDISGVVYENFDDAGGWKFKLAKEMKVSGCEIDMNKII